MTANSLRLEVTEFTDLTRWRWVLKDAGGAFLADHEVRLDPGAAQFEAFTGLLDYIDLHAAPDKRLATEARIVTTLGDWIGTEVLGPAIGRTLVGRSPATVEVILPEGAERLAYLPLETARVQSRSLTAHDITLIIRTAADHTVARAKDTTNQLRVLGLFSLPEGGTALNLRRERQSLVTLINTIAATGRAADVKVLQYGVTRDKLRDILEDGDGWDIIHISGHGSPGQLILETADGRPDHIDATVLADLLDLARARIKLVTVSACWSAALATAEPRRLLGLPTPGSPERTVVPSPPRAPASNDIATILAEHLGCAVLAMRFPVDDEFSIELAQKFYALLNDKGQSLPRAVALSLRHLTESGPALRFPALSMAAPAIFGSTAAKLTLKAPPRTAPVSYATETLKMAGFPPQPERFVGRTAVMTRASAALAPGSDIPGVILHGMPGGGKTACALELAYTHEDAFQKLIWFKAPDEGTAIDGSLTDFALTLERELPGLEMIDKVVTDEALTAFLPKLTELMKRARLLLVIDNAESLLTDTGQWRDEQWGKVVAGLTGHAGLSRVIITSRRVLARMPGIRVETVDALSADEALLLIRELPHLRALISGKPEGLAQDTGRNLALGVLNIAQGHPKLLELANGQATHPDQLAALVQVGGQAWQEQGTLPDGFFTTEEASVTPSDYLHVLSAWTNTVTDTLSPSERDLFWFLCCLEEADRERSILEPIWPMLRTGLRRSGMPPHLGQALDTLSHLGLATIRAENGNKSESYGLHPGIAAAGRDQAGPDFQSHVDIHAAAYWEAVYEYAAGNNEYEAAHTRMLVRASLAAVPYLLHRGKWDRAADLMENAFLQEQWQSSTFALLPTIIRIVDHDPLLNDGRLTLILHALDSVTGETQLCAALDAAVARGDYRTASAAARHLVYIHEHSGRLDQALIFADRSTKYTHQAGLGPWTQLSDHVNRLRIMNEMGSARDVFDEIQRLGLHTLVDTLPKRPSSDEIVSSWRVREDLLYVGRAAAHSLGLWEIALKMGEVIAISQQERRAPAADVARNRYNDYGALLQLHRTEDALDLLRDCRQAFEDTNDIEMLSSALIALSDVEHRLGHGNEAFRAARDALRLNYSFAGPADITVCYHNLGTCLALDKHQPAMAYAAHLAAALIRTFTGVGGTSDGSGSAAHSTRAAADDLRELGTAADCPVSIADLCRRLDDMNIPGTDPAGLIEKLTPDPETAERILQDLVAQAQAMAREPKQEA